MRSLDVRHAVHLVQNGGPSIPRIVGIKLKTPDGTQEGTGFIKICSDCGFILEARCSHLLTNGRTAEITVLDTQKKSGIRRYCLLCGADCQKGEEGEGGNKPK